MICLSPRFILSKLNIPRVYILLKTQYPHPVLKIIVFKSFFRVLFFELTFPPPLDWCYVLWVCFLRHFRGETYPWWDISMVRRFHSTPLTLEKLFFKWIRNMIISFSYCKVKVVNDNLTLLVKQYSFKSSNKLVKKVSCNKNNHIPL